ncbi:MAG: hypothetical protein JSW60_06055 [Thermoplasmatales archaeon]|nr:MAG: hypothetical protein JSW60_06055 [Thermoplasmatales archaeon]
MKEEKSYSITDIRETNPQLEKHRRDVIEKYMEYEIVLMHEFKDQDKTLDDVIEHMKTTLWYVKNQRAQRIKKELGM